MTGPVGTKVAINSRNRQRASQRLDHWSRFSTRVVGEVRVLIEADNAQGGGNGAAARRQELAANPSIHHIRFNIAECAVTISPPSPHSTVSHWGPTRNGELEC
jgi:hypothetical protein